MESRLEGEKPEIFKRGQYGAPGTVHVVSRNASSTKPAKLLVFFVQEKGKVPAQQRTLPTRLTEDVGIRYPIVCAPMTLGIVGGVARSLGD